MSNSIAIDGPAGAGKSTIAKKLAAKLGYIYIDTGAMYRAMALFFLDEGISQGDTEQIGRRCGEAVITIIHENGEQAVLLNGTNVNGRIREEAVGKMASVSSANATVREQMVKLQRMLAENANVVMDGRDIGTCVLPNANVKVYLTADAGVRAKRRYDELTAKGEACDLSQIREDIVSRDHQDMTRAISPLVQAPDALLVDSSHMTIDQVVEALLALCGKAGCEKPWK